MRACVCMCLLVHTRASERLTKQTSEYLSTYTYCSICLFCMARAFHNRQKYTHICHFKIIFISSLSPSLSLSRSLYVFFQNHFNEDYITLQFLFVFQVVEIFNVPDFNHSQFFRCNCKTKCHRIHLYVHVRSSFSSSFFVVTSNLDSHMVNRNVDAIFKIQVYLSKLFDVLRNVLRSCVQSSNQHNGQTN